MFVEVFLFVVLSLHYRFSDYLRISTFWIFESTFAVVSICKISWGWFKHSQIYQALNIEPNSANHTQFYSPIFDKLQTCICLYFVFMYLSLDMYFSPRGEILFHLGHKSTKVENISWEIRPIGNILIKILFLSYVSDAYFCFCLPDIMVGA